MTNRILSRIIQALVVLWATFTLAFLLLAALPGDAVGARFDNPALGLSPEQITKLRQTYGTDRPLLVRYFDVLGNFLTGDFGNSVNSGAKVTTLIAKALPGTIQLAVAAFLLAIVLALALAAVATLPKAAPLRDFFRGLPPIFSALPTFLVGIVLIQLVSFQLRWVPVVNTGTWQGLILPAIALALPITAQISQVLIRGIDDAATQPFARVAQARGGSRFDILIHHTLRNALLPALTIAGVVFGELIGGAVVTETVFGRAGIGLLTVAAVGNRDTPVMLAIVVIAAAVYVLINLIVDLLYPVVDARLRRNA